MNTETTRLKRDRGPTAVLAQPRSLATALRERGALPALGWTGLVCGCFWLAQYAELAQVPAPSLLVPMVVGVVLALSGAVTATPPRPAMTTAHALVGVLMGSYLDPDMLGALAGQVVPLVAVTAATVLISVVAALLLTRTGRIGRADAVLGTLPGGSAAILATADDLGADTRQVAFAQYLRVGLVALTAPLVAMVVGGEVDVDSAHGPARLAQLTQLVTGPDGVSWPLVLIAVCVLGVRAGRWLRLPSPVVLGPMLITVLATVTDTEQDFAPSGTLRELAFVLIGLEVGLRFTRTSVRHVRRLLPHLLVITGAVCLLSAGVAGLLSATTAIPFIDAYLATTPGGINAVLAVASATHSNIAMVSAVQSLRLFLIVLVAPPLVRWLCPSPPRPATSTAEE